MNQSCSQKFRFEEDHFEDSTWATVKAVATSVSLQANSATGIKRVKKPSLYNSGLGHLFTFTQSTFSGKTDNYLISKDLPSIDSNNCLVYPVEANLAATSRNPATILFFPIENGDKYHFKLIQVLDA